MKKNRFIDKFLSPRYVDKPITAAMLLLVFFGSIMVVSASMGLAIGNAKYLAATTVKLIGFGVLGYLGMVFFSRKFSFENADKSMEVIMAGIIIVLLLCLAFPGAGGAKAWIQIPFPGVELTVQPSEFAKIACIVAIANYLGDNRKRYDRLQDLLIHPLGFVFGCFGIILILQSDLGSAVVLLFISMVCLLIPQHRMLKKVQRNLLALLVVGIIFVGVMLLTPMGEKIIMMLPLKPYQINRILSSINPFVDQYDTGYQLINGLIAFATGGFAGKGFGNSVRKYTQFPAANTDFILSIVVEELGFLGFLFIAVLYLIIIVRLFKYAFKMHSEKGRIILVGVAMYLFIHFFFNVGGVTGFIPLTGVPLLMISAGGSSTMSIMMAVGIAQAVISQYREGKIY